MNRIDIKPILIALNSTENYDKYPIGNKGLNEVTKRLESDGRIKWNDKTRKWEKVNK